ncbi:FtsK/SpoIIIE domain-containing protein [Amycolatopsis sp. NPDC051716]|uniref:FtsK/SpoIIIE domain-containing protein n=1 Tax=Amycolatopsis sp. NPDC051716 TaxID=3155804 RepID=UPI003435C178
MSDEPNDLVKAQTREPVDVGPVLDAELVDDEPTTVTSTAHVPPAPATDDLPGLLRARRATMRPIFPAWLRDRDEAVKVAHWAAGYAGHVAAYHAVRVPLYLLKLAGWTPRGLWITGAAGARWTFDLEARPLRHAAVLQRDAETYLKLARERRQRVRTRLLVAVLATIGAGLVYLLAWPLLPPLATLAAGLVALVTFGLLGAPPDRPVLTHAVIVDRYTRLTPDMVERALAALGIAALNPKTGRATFAAPIQRDGPGWRAEVDLPYGVTAADVGERRDRLASGLRRPLGCVWPEPATDEHPGRLVLWVGDVAMSKAKPAPWPLLKGGEIDLFKPVPFMVDQRGRPVGVDLVFTNVLIGAMPRMGKTFTVRELVLAAALDPHVLLRLFELKGTGDLGMCERVAHRYASGAGADALEMTMASLREVYADLETRSKTITRIAKETPARCPENKVTPELSREGRLGLGLEFLVIDECQELFSSKEHRDEAERLAEGIIKRGPAMGVILVLATQRPDAKSLPKSVSDNIGIRFCLRVMGQEPNDMVLGTSSYKNGIRASTFTARDKGIGYLVGAFDDPLIGRTYYLDGPAADRVIDRAYALREAAGTLTGHAAGEPVLVVDVAADVRAIFGAGDEKLWTTTILERLAALRPQVYAGWSPEQLAAALRPFEVRSQQVWGTASDGKGANRQGYLLAEIARGGTS